MATTPGAEAALLAGVQASEWSWQPIFMDVDLDGLPDLLISSGHARDVQDADSSNKIGKLKQNDQLLSTLDIPKRPTLAKQDKFSAELLAMAKLRPRLDTPIVAFRNKGDLTFEEKDWGTGALAVHHGMATADLDGDGDLDLVVNNLYEPAGIYRNNSPAPRVAVRLSRRKPKYPGHRSNRHFALDSVRSNPGGDCRRPLCERKRCLPVLCCKREGDDLEVRWRSGAVSVMKDVKANRLYTIDESTARNGCDCPRSLIPTVAMFTDYQPKLRHVHPENAFDDFKRQSLLPNRLSQNGPGVAFTDLNNDGQDEMLGRLRGWQRHGRVRSRPGGHRRSKHSSRQATTRDQAGIATYSPSPGEVRVLAGVVEL